MLLGGGTKGNPGTSSQFGTGRTPDQACQAGGSGVGPWAPEVGCTGNGTVCLSFILRCLSLSLLYFSSFLYP